jgi:hypothetical protein
LENLFYPTLHSFFLQAQFQPQSKRQHRSPTSFSAQRGPPPSPRARPASLSPRAATDGRDPPVIPPAAPADRAGVELGSDPDSRPYRTIPGPRARSPGASPPPI